MKSLDEIIAENKKASDPGSDFPAKPKPFTVPEGQPTGELPPVEAYQDDKEVVNTDATPPNESA